MTDERLIREIINQYEKHGWNLRRVLLSAATVGKVAPEIFGAVEIRTAEVNALWFARAAANGGEAWELRNLAATAFALIEVFDRDDEEETREEARLEMETQMRLRASKPIVPPRKN